MKKLLLRLFLVYCLFRICPCSGETSSDEEPIYENNDQGKQVKRELNPVRLWSQEQEEEARKSHEILKKRCEPLREMATKIKPGVSTEEDIISMGLTWKLSPKYRKDYRDREKIWRQLPSDQKILYYENRGTCSLTVLIDKASTVVVDYFLDDWSY